MILLALACAPEPPPPVDPPAVVVIVSDTVRADLGGLDAPDWWAGGRRYTNAYSAAPYTTASTATLATGRYPDGVERGWPAGGPPPCEGEDHRQPQRIPWPADAWPDLLLMDQPVPAMMAGLPVRPFEGPGSEALFAEAIDALDDGHRGIYVHSVGAHDPYDGIIGGKRSPGAAALAHATACDGEVPPDVSAWALLTYPWGIRRALVGVPELIVAAIATGATVVWTSDHGEALGEDGLWGHATSLHDAQVRVPLYVWGPGVVEGTDPTPVPATCVGQTAQVVLGQAEPGACDLRTGDIRGEVEAGMLMASGEWITRHPVAEGLAVTPGDVCAGLDREHKLSDGAVICGGSVDACLAEAELAQVRCRGGVSLVQAVDPKLGAACAQARDAAVAECR